MSRNKWSDEKLFQRLIHNKSNKTYWNNIQELRYRANPNVFRKAKELANSNIEKEIIIGINVLAQLGRHPRPFLNETLSLYFNLLKKTSNPKVVSSILYAIGHNNDDLSELQVSELIVFLNNKNAEVRQALVYSLLGIKHFEAINTLISLSKDKIASIRNWATFGIGTQIDVDEPYIREALWNRTKDKDQETKLEAIAGLAQRHDIKIKEIIKQEIITGEFGTILFEAIEEFNDYAFVPLLEDLFNKINHDESINPKWIDELKQTITSLKKKNET